MQPYPEKATKVAPTQKGESRTTAPEAWSGAGGQGAATLQSRRLELSPEGGSALLNGGERAFQARIQRGQANKARL